MEMSNNPVYNIVNQRYLLELNSSISHLSRDIFAAVKSHRDLFSVQFEQLQLQVMNAVRPASPCICQNTAVCTMSCIINCLYDNRNSIQYSLKTFYLRNGSELSQIPFLYNLRQ